MFVAAYSRTEASARRIAQERGLRFPPMQDAPEPPRAPASPPVAPLVYKPQQRCADVEIIPTPFADTRRVIDLVARMHGVTYRQVMGRSRRHRICHVRQAAICAVMQHFLERGVVKGQPEIARLFGGLHHTTVLHAVRVRGFR